MIQLSTSVIDATAAGHLAAVQARIDAEPRAKQAKFAADRWGDKGGAGGAAAFKTIKSALLALCVGTEVCNYCENNEATDIEHVFPKSFFPERAFRWENYLLACKTCNTAYKLDRFTVFAPAGSSTEHVCVRQALPPTDDAAFVDPRTDDPLDYFWLDIEAKSFHFVPHPALTDPRRQRKAAITLDILGIGTRPALVEARRKAAQYFLDRLDRYVRVQAATTFAELENIAQDPYLVDKTQPLAQEQQQMANALRDDIRTHAHPTVWQELKRQHPRLRTANRLFGAAPEALTW